MMTVLTFLVVALGLIALVQMVRVYELAKELRGKKEEDISRKDNKFNAVMWLVFMAFLYLGYAWLMVEYSDKLLPESASVHGVKTDTLLDFNWIIVNFVFFVTNTMLFVFAYKYHNQGQKASYVTHNNKLELIWTAIPAVVMMVIIVYGLSTWNEITQDAPEDSIIVELYAKQFDWTARYPGDDGELGRSFYKFIDGGNFLGLDSADTRCNDDKIVKGEFHLPVNKSVKFVIRAQDVLHSMYLPHFRTQMNAVPGMVTTFHMIPTITTAEMKEKTGNPEFEYVLLCNKICGASHYNMQMNVVVESEEDYNKWLADQPAFNVNKSEEIIAQSSKESNNVVENGTDSVETAEPVIN